VGVPRWMRHLVASIKSNGRSARGWPRSCPDQRGTLHIRSGHRPSHCRTSASRSYLTDENESELAHFILHHSLYPPAIAPTTQKGSAPEATAAGSGVSGGSRDRSCWQAKYLRKGRRCPLT